MVDLRGNVKIITSDSTIMTGSQLYWDQENEWVFTDYKYQLELPNGAKNIGEGFDADQKFNNFNSRINTGIQYIED